MASSKRLVIPHSSVLLHADSHLGNFYGIENDYDKPARIFFSQGCEIEAASVEGQITLPEAQ